MNRWILLFVCAASGVALLVCGLLVPAHLRAVDKGVIEKAGANSPTLVARGLASVREGNLGAAQLLLQTAREKKISGWDQLDAAVTEFKKQDSQGRQSEPFTELVIRVEIRDKILGSLQSSSERTAQELLRLRAVTNTAVFPPSRSAAGQAFDAAISICGLLADNHQLTAGLSNSVLTLASQANRGGDSRPIEEILMDMMSLGQRFNLDQLVAFVGQIGDARTLHLLANQVRKADAQLSVVFSAVVLSDNPAGLAGYLENFDKSGVTDLGASLPFGAGGVNELLRRDQRLNISNLRPQIFSTWCLRMPWFALSVKWGFYLGGGFLLAMAMHFARRVQQLERPLQVRGFHFAREFLFSLGFLLVVLLVSEPFLAQESQKTEFRFQLRLPTVGGAVPVSRPGVSSNQTFMNQEVLLTMLLFFVLQALLYVACLVKLAEIRRQRIGPRMKLKLLENEDHLFDAGLYLGFFGTIVSLILVSLGVFKQPSLMAAYSSTSFGILFVSFFKICHLRAARRKLLLEADAAQADEAEAPAPVQTYAVS
jgi:hypothetical protein